MSRAEHTNTTNPSRRTVIQTAAVVPLAGAVAAVPVAAGEQADANLFTMGRDLAAPDRWTDDDADANECLVKASIEQQLAAAGLPLPLPDPMREGVA